MYAAAPRTRVEGGKGGPRTSVCKAKRSAAVAASATELYSALTYCGGTLSDMRVSGAIIDVATDRRSCAFHPTNVFWN